mgnify:FL=1
MAQESQDNAPMKELRASGTSARILRRAARACEAALAAASIMADSVSLQQCVELIHAEIGLPQDRAQRTPIELLVVGDHQLRERMVTPQHDMGAVLALQIETGFGESLDAVPAREPGQLAQTATSSVPKCSSGTGSLSSCRAAM